MIFRRNAAVNVNVILNICKYFFKIWLLVPPQGMTQVQI